MESRQQSPLSYYTFLLEKHSKPTDTKCYVSYFFNQHFAMCLTVFYGNICMIEESKNVELMVLERFRTFLKKNKIKQK